MWQHLVLLNCIILLLWWNLSQCWAVLSSAELKASRFLKTKCLLNLKKDLHRTTYVNLVKVMSGTDSHLVNSDFSILNHQNIV